MRVAAGWNYADFFCFIFYFVFFAWYVRMQDLAGSREAALGTAQCSEVLCQQVGYFDSHDALYQGKKVRDLLSICMVVILLKTIKFINYYVPSTSLLVNVLAKGRMELITFCFVLFLVLFAFSVAFWLRLGSHLAEFSTILGAMKSVARALFGDFDVDELEAQYSPNSTTVYIFILFAFVLINIVLSIFLAILSEAQGDVREEEAQKREAKEERQRKRKEREEQARVSARMSAQSEASAGLSEPSLKPKKTFCGHVLQILIDFIYALRRSAEEGLTADDEAAEAPNWIKALEPAEVQRVLNYQFVRLKKVHTKMNRQAAKVVKQGPVVDDDDDDEEEMSAPPARPSASVVPGGPVAQARARGAARASVRGANVGADVAVMQFALEAALAKHMGPISARLSALEASVAKKSN